MLNNNSVELFFIQNLMQAQLQFVKDAQRFCLRLSVFMHSSCETLKLTVSSVRRCWTEASMITPSGRIL